MRKFKGKELLVWLLTLVFAIGACVSFFSGDTKETEILSAITAALGGIAILFETNREDSESDAG